LTGRRDRDSIGVDAKFANLHACDLRSAKRAHQIGLLEGGGAFHLRAGCFALATGAAASAAALKPGGKAGASVMTTKRARLVFALASSAARSGA